MRRCLSIALVLVCAAAAGQDREVLKAALYITGAATEEELDQSAIEMLEERRGRLVCINSNSLRPNEILSSYQVAVIQDYRSRSGDILSWEELSLLEGFSKSSVDALKPFLSLYSSRLPGAADTVRTHVQTFARATLNSAGGKAKVTGRYWRAGGAVRCSGGFKKWDGTFYGEASPGSHRIIAGDYKLRLGQGLALWTGFSMDNLSTVNAFVKRSQGISPVWSFSSEAIQRGAAYQYCSTHWSGSAFASIDRTIGIRADYLGRIFQAGVTVATLPSAPYIVSADAKLNLRGTILTGELACKGGSFAGLAAFVMPLGEYFRVAGQGRIVPSKYSGKKYGEYAMALGGEFKRGKVSASLTADASLLPIPQKDPGRFQLRVWSGAKWQITPEWALETRLTERYRNYENPRTALRLHSGFILGPWSANLRAEAVWCRQWGILGYGEAGYKGESITAWLRITGFMADSWDARIYVYERDAPGSFLVSAYYGRGGAVSLVGNWKHRFKYLTLKTYLRGAYTFKNGHVPAPVLNVQIAVEY